MDYRFSAIPHLTCCVRLQPEEKFTSQRPSKFRRTLVANTFNTFNFSFYSSIDHTQRVSTCGRNTDPSEYRRLTISTTQGYQTNWRRVMGGPSQKKISVNKEALQKLRDRDNGLFHQLDSSTNGLFHQLDSSTN